MPLPLSLMPGPSTTESRWAPTTTTLSAFRPSASRRCTFEVVRVQVDLGRVVTTRTVTGPAWVCGVERRAVGEAEPDDRDGRPVLPSVPMSSSSRPGWPSLKMIDRVVAGRLRVGGLDLEGAGTALDQRDLRLGRRGRRSRAASQPEVALGVGVGGITMSLVGTSRAGDVAAAGVVERAGLVHRRRRRDLRELGRRQFPEEREVELLLLHLVAGLLQRVVT